MSDPLAGLGGIGGSSLAGWDTQRWLGGPARSCGRVGVMFSPEGDSCCTGSRAAAGDLAA